MSPRVPIDLGRRERQIVEVVFRLGRATVADVLAELPDPPSYSSVRAMLRILETKGHLKHEQDGPRYVYLPAMPQEKARRSVLRHMVNTFFGGSAVQAAAALLESEDATMSDGDLQRLRRLIARARTKER